MRRTPEDQRDHAGRRRAQYGRQRRVRLLQHRTTQQVFTRLFFQSSILLVFAFTPILLFRLDGFGAATFLPWRCRGDRRRAEEKWPPKCVTPKKRQWDVFQLVCWLDEMTDSPSRGLVLLSSNELMGHHQSAAQFLVTSTIM